MKTKTILLTAASIVLLFVCSNLHAQVPQKFNYQAVARNAAGEIMGNQTISIRFSILDGSPSGTNVYTEEHTSITTNNLGLFKLSIGTGTPLSGTFSGVAWSSGNKYLKIELNTGTGYQLMGNEQLVSVPYALAAGNSTSSIANLTDVSVTGVSDGQVLKWSVANNQWEPANDIGGGVGDNWGTQVAQTDATLSGNGTAGNQLKIAQQGAASGQVLKWNGSSWTPSADNDTDTDDQTLSLSGTGLSISSGNTVDLSSFMDDTDNQTLSLNGNTLSISGGNSVALPSGGSGDNWGTQAVQTDTTLLSGDGTTSSPLTINGSTESYRALRTNASGDAYWSAFGGYIVNRSSSISNAPTTWTLEDINSSQFSNLCANATCNLLIKIYSPVSRTVYFRFPGDLNAVEKVYDVPAGRSVVAFVELQNGEFEYYSDVAGQIKFEYIGFYR